MKCEKATYLTLNEARIALTKVMIKSKRKIKPIRIYKCEHCGMYHLTSKTERQYKTNLQLKNKEIKKRNQIREKAFIERESNHWNEYFGIEY